MTVDVSALTQSIDALAAQVARLADFLTAPPATTTAPPDLMPREGRMTLTIDDLQHQPAGAVVVDIDGDEWTKTHAGAWAFKTRDAVARSGGLWAAYGPIRMSEGSC